MKRYTELPAFSSDQEVCTSLTKVADRKIHPKEILLSMINKQFVLVDKRYHVFGMISKCIGYIHPIPLV